jgi:phenol 2-monooxygenase (NADPH)
VRPDQYVAHVLPLDDYAGVAAFFGRFMLQADQQQAPVVDPLAL